MVTEPPAKTSTGRRLSCLHACAPVGPEPPNTALQCRSGFPVRFCCSIVEHAWPGEAARVRWSLSLPQKPALVADFRAYTPVHQLARNHQTLHCNVGAVSPCGFAAQSSSMHGPERPRVSPRSWDTPKNQHWSPTFVPTRLCTSWPGTTKHCTAMSERFPRAVLLLNRRACMARRGRACQMVTEPPTKTSTGRRLSCLHACAPVGPEPPNTALQCRSGFPVRFCCSIVEHAWPGEAARLTSLLGHPQKPALVADFRAYTPVHQLARNHQTLHCNVGAVSPCGFAAQSSSMHGPERPRVSDGH